MDWAKYNCEVVATAWDAQSGTQAIRTHRPDILFTDIRMPNIDGLTMLASLRSEFPDMQITVLSGYRDFEYAKRAISIGVARFLVKPSKMDEINEALATMTRRLDRKNQKESAQEKNAELSSGEKNEANSFIVNKALEYISRHYNQKISLSELADKIYVSQWYLSKLLNKYTGKNFYDLLNQSRIRKAKELLGDPALKIGEISELVGFIDVSHFSRIFKKSEGRSPKEYRNALKGE
jgi:two-component system response regulator YesN